VWSNFVSESLYATHRAGVNDTSHAPVGLRVAQLQQLDDVRTSIAYTDLLSDQRLVRISVRTLYTHIVAMMKFCFLFATLAALAEGKNVACNSNVIGNNHMWSVGN